MDTQRTWHTVVLQDPKTGERLITHEKALDQDEANQLAFQHIRQAGSDLLVVID